MNVTDKSIIRLLLRAMLLLLCAALPCVALYLWLDPFKVVRQYGDYMENPDEVALRVGMNKGVVTLKAYESAFEGAGGFDGLREPNAFIFGSSISCYYDAREWAGMLQRSRGAEAVWPFHFDSASESPMSMARKVEYLHDGGAPLDYALVILDPIIMANPDQDSPFAIDPPELHHEAFYPLHFHYTFFRGAMNFDFMKSFIAGHLTGEAKNFGHNPIFEEQPIVYDKLTNQETLPLWDSLIRTDPEGFYAEHPLLPPADSVTAGKALLAPLIRGASQGSGASQDGGLLFDGDSGNSALLERTEAFERIAQIFREHATDYEVIVSPNRRGVGLAAADLATLQAIFGKDRVHDFSYSEAPQLRQDTLLYDNTHYRPPFASRLLRRVYLEP